MTDSLTVARSSRRSSTADGPSLVSESAWLDIGGIWLDTVGKTDGGRAQVSGAVGPVWTDGDGGGIRDGSLSRLNAMRWLRLGT